MEPFETEEHAGFICELHYDFDAGNPYTEWDQASKLLSDVKDYDLGADVPHPESWYRETPSSKVMQRYLTMFDGYAIAIRWTFQDYGSSGARTWLDTPDDDPAHGWLVMTTETVEKEWNGDLAAAEKCARAEFDSFRAWIEQEVCGYVVRDPETDDIIDSCWGFYGETEYVMEEARKVAEYERKERLLNQEPTDVAERLATL